MNKERDNEKDMVGLFLHALTTAGGLNYKECGLARLR